jgi:hypothetical protein
MNIYSYLRLWRLIVIALYSEFADKFERNCRFASRLKCMTYCQTLRGFSDTSQVSLHKSNKIILPFFTAVLAGSQEVTRSTLSVNARYIRRIPANEAAD